jgi:hypothetical protein
MKKAIVFVLAALILAFPSCQKKSSEGKPVGQNFRGSTSDTVSVVQLSKSAYADTMYLDLKILDPKGSKVFYKMLDKGNIKIMENGSTDPNFVPKVNSVEDIRDKRVISDQISMLFLIDRSGSISPEDLSKQYDLILNILNSDIKAKVYLSFMDNSVTTSKLATKDNLKVEFAEEFTVKEGSQKYLYKAVMAKMEELSSDTATCYPEISHLSDLGDSTQKILFVLTDGKVNNMDGSPIGGAQFYTWKRELRAMSRAMRDSKKQYIPIYCIFAGDPKDIESESELEMKAFCATIPAKNARTDLKGKFFKVFSADELQKTLYGSLDSIAADYRLVLVNPGGKIYDGTERVLTITVQDDQHEPAVGQLPYAFGNKQVQIRVPSKEGGQSNLSIILLGLCYGLVSIILIYLVLQYLLPWIQYKVFCKRYVVKYNGNKDGSTVEQQLCYHCKEPFQNGDIIVTKCEHVVHWECWKENRNRCPEYGAHSCRKGIHYYNQDKLSDHRNAPYFLMWLVYGLLAGLVSWVFMRLLYSESLFSSLINALLRLLRPTDNMLGVSSMAFVPKIQSMLLCGILLGFFIILFFGYLIEFRKKDFKVWGQILLRSVVGGVSGFIAFLLGAVVIILLNKPANCFYTDWIPWALFAIAMAFVLSYNTDIKLQNALIGGLISVLVSFVVLFLGTFAKDILSMFSYMIYAAGLGIAIAVVHHISEKYFLRVSGPVQERDIAIYKWMSVSGGFNHVTIGKSIDCILEMNWDDATNIADKQVEIYLENDRPYCKALEDGTFLSNGQMLQKNQVVLLSPGTEFTIGNTLFTYIEKDK